MCIRDRYYQAWRHGSGCSSSFHQNSCHVIKSARAEAVDEDAVDMEENDVTIGDHFPLHDIRSTLACVNSKWRETALDATPSPDDYLTTLEEDRIPCAIEFLGQQKEQVETYGGVEYIKVFAGEGVILKDHEDIWRMLSTSYTPPKWGEHFQSSQTIPQEKKRRISSGADLNLN
eukprot:2465600-Alexandrium_andersonii.AAC.1